MAPQEQPQRFPKGILPEGISPPQGTDIMQFCRDLAESGADFAEQFDRSSATFHNGNTTAVPMGGERVPETMGGAANADWQSLPEAPAHLALEQDFGPEYHRVTKARQDLDKCKKAISVLNKPVEMVYKLRMQYKGAEGEDKVALESRIKGAVNSRDGAIAAATELVLQASKDLVSDRTRDCVQEVADRGRFNFEDQESFGEYMQVLQRANQAIFRDMNQMLQTLKVIKKAAVEPQQAAAAAAKGEALVEAAAQDRQGAEAEPAVAVGGA